MIFRRIEIEHPVKNILEQDYASLHFVALDLIYNEIQPLSARMQCVTKAALGELMKELLESVEVGEIELVKLEVVPEIELDERVGDRQQTRRSLQYGELYQTVHDRFQLIKSTDKEKIEEWLKCWESSEQEKTDSK